MKVISFKEAPPDLPAWWLLEVEGQTSPLLVGHNWVAANGQLQPGDEIKLDVTKFLHYRDSSYPFVLNITRVPKEALVE